MVLSSAPTCTALLETSLVSAITSAGIAVVSVDYRLASETKLPLIVSYGVDVSNHQGEIDWQAVVGHNIEFAYIKATEGGDFTDEWFESN